MSYQEEIAQKIQRRPGEKSDSISTEEANFIHDLITKNKIKKTLEIGLSYGFSAAHIIHATRSKHVVVEPFAQARDDLGIKNLASLDYLQYLELREERSHNALPSLVNENKQFEFIFIDGGHKYDEIFIDWYYSDLLLEPHGFILFHDDWMRSSQLVGSFIRNNRTDYREIKTGAVGSLMLFQKFGRDDRPWYHFNEFYTRRGMKSHHQFLVKRVLECRMQGEDKKYDIMER
jgi:predicted O-methyltransferase YrrM